MPVTNLKRGDTAVWYRWFTKPFWLNPESVAYTHRMGDQNKKKVMLGRYTFVKKLNGLWASNLALGRDFDLFTEDASHA
ncbi:hypothetical protein GCM10009092_21780 [Bowmanella denitrificans]|uniref:Uncharacterized protein n=1 Tax=Bowmanella denitrificans TaxID=366582 RepID=A0ABN0X7L9_9ALTE